MTPPGLPPEAVPAGPPRARVYAAGLFVAGLVGLVLVAIPVAGIQSTAPVGGPPPAGLTGTGDGLGPSELLLASAVALALLVPLTLAGGWFVAGRFLRPLRSIAAAATRISAGNLDERLDLGEPTDELTELGHILDDLFARLEASFASQRHFVANASHELRTPLAGQRTVLEVALADPGADAASLRSACHEVLVLGEHQEQLIHALLALATSERGATRSVRIDLADVAGAELASRQGQAERRDLRLAAHLAPAVTTGDPGLIGSLVANLVDNAIRHSHPGGPVEIRTEAVGAEAVITVRNAGPVIPGDQVPRLWRPFERLAPDRHGPDGGAGLGLAIVDAVARAHHAPIAADAPPSGGLIVSVRFAALRQPSVPPASGGTDGPD